MSKSSALRQEPVLEGDIMKQAKALLRFLKAHRLVNFRRIHVGPIMRGSPGRPVFQRNVDMAGFTDLLVGVVATGKCIFIEAKTESGRLSPVQQEFHSDWRRLGFTVEVFRSIVELENILEANGVKLPYDRKKSPCPPGNTTVKNAQVLSSTAPTSQKKENT